MDHAGDLAVGSDSTGELVAKLTVFMELVSAKASGNGDINAAMMLLVRQMGASMMKQLAKQDPTKMRQGLIWFQDALTNINDPHVSIDEFRIWANS